MSKSRKAFIFSLDALIAIVAATVIIGASFFYLSQVQTLNWSQPSITVISMDTLTTLRVDGTLKRAIEDDSNKTIELFFDKMYPSNICGGIELYDRHRSLILTANKTGCDSPPGDSESNELFVSRRTFIVNKQMHYVFLRTWYT
jgi:hypothetical protein